MTRLLSLVTAAALLGCAVEDNSSLDGVTTPVLNNINVNQTTGQLAPPLSDVLDLEVEGGVQFGTVTFTASNLGASEPVYFIASTAGAGAGPCPPVVGGDCLDILGPIVVAGTAVADSSGIATLSVNTPSTVAVGDEVFFQAVAVRGPGGNASVASEVDSLTVADGTSNLRVVHASFDAPAVDIYADGALAVPDVAYGDASGFLPVQPGTLDIDIRAAGADPASAPVFSETLTIGPDETLTAVATGSFTSSAPGGGFQVLPLVEAWGPDLPDSTRVRIVHGGTGVPGVTLDVGNDGTIDLSNIFRFTATDAEGVPLPSNTPLAASISQLVNGEFLSSFSLPALPDGEEVLVIASGQKTGEPRDADAFQLLAVFNDSSTAFIGQDPRLYALHASPDAPAVDISTGGSVVIPGLAFGDLAGPLQVPPGAYDLDISGLVTYTTPTLVAGDEALAIATGFLAPMAGMPGFVVLPIIESMDTSGFDVPLQLVHASPDAPAVDVGIVDDTGAFVPLVPGVVFSDITGPDDLIVGAGSYQFAVALAGDSTPLFTFPTLDLVDGNRFIVVASGSVAAGTFGLQLVDVAASPFTVTAVAPL